MYWLTDFRDEIYYWNRIISIGAIARELVRTENIHINIVDHFEEAIAPIAIGPKELRFADQISLFLLEQTRGLKQGEYLLGSTEILESVFGKLKYMEKEQTAFGFTSLVLAAAACIGPTDSKIIEEAIKSHTMKEIDEWCEKEIGKTVQSQRREINKLFEDITDKLGQEVAPLYERKVAGF